MENENTTNPREENSHGFGLPENYFEKSTQSIQTKIELLEEKAKYPFLFSLRKHNVFGVPQNFFLQSEFLIEKRVTTKLPYKSQTDVFQVPKNYFESSRRNLQTALSKKYSHAKVISMFRPISVWAVAAVFIILLGTWFFVDTSVPVSEDCTTLACLDKSELLQARDLEEFDTDELYGSVNTERLQLNIKDQTTFYLDSEERIEQFNDDFIND